MKLKNNISEILLLSFILVIVIIISVKTTEQFQNPTAAEEAIQKAPYDISGIKIDVSGRILRAGTYPNAENEINMTNQTINQSAFTRIFNYFKNLWNPPPRDNSGNNVPPSFRVNQELTQGELIYKIFLIILPTISILSLLYFMFSLVNGSKPSYMSLIVSMLFGITFFIMLFIK